MDAKQKPKGPWVHRIARCLLGVVLAVLIFWLLGFIVEDIRSIRGPQYAAIEKRHIDPSLDAENTSLRTQLGDLARRITDLKDQQQMARDSSQNLQGTIDQLVELQKLSIQKEIAPPESQQQSLADSVSHFLESQKKYQELNSSISELAEQKRRLDEQRQGVEAVIEQQQGAARDEFDRLNRKHRLKLAFFQLLILVPLLVAGGVLIVRKRSSIYFPLLVAFMAAVLVKVALVVHEYFPARYFKYILVGVLLLAVARLLIHFIRSIAFPQKQWLMRQYREAYERFLCPLCEYPIRVGPRRFLYWTRRTVNKIVPQGEQVGEDERYTCPSCGTTLFETCPACQAIRHSLLAHCRHCGAEKDVG